MRRLLAAMAALCVVGAGLGAEPTSPLGQAEALYNAGRFSEARALLEPIAHAQPANLEAAFYLGMSCHRMGGPQSLDDAHTWLGKASKGDPSNEEYLAEYSGVCLLLADRDQSLSLAIEGRDGMQKAIAAEPGDLEAREGLMRFYASAPWPLGSRQRALDQAAEIARRDPSAGREAYLKLAAIFERRGKADEAALARASAQALASASTH